MNHSSEGHPTLSVIVAASGSTVQLKRCLDALENQSLRGEMEIIVVSNGPESPPLPPDSRISTVSMADSTTVPRLRAEGIARSSGEFVVLTEDNVAATRTWAEEIVRAHAAGHAIVGGPVDHEETGRLLDRAVYFYEYGRFMPPAPEGSAGSLPGNNVSYSRRILDELGERMDNGFFEAFIHEDLKRRGHELYMHPPAEVRHIGRYEAGNVFRACYHHARAYAGTRTEGRGAGERGLLAAGSVLLPAVLTARIGRVVVARSRRVGSFLGSLVWLVPFMCSWGAGEFMGYTAGKGESEKYWT